jgi:hypothetical protein
MSNERFIVHCSLFIVHCSLLIVNVRCCAPLVRLRRGLRTSNSVSSIRWRRGQRSRPLNRSVAGGSASLPRLAPCRWGYPGRKRRISPTYKVRPRRLHCRPWQQSGTFPGDPPPQMHRNAVQRTGLHGSLSELGLLFLLLFTAAFLVAIRAAVAISALPCLLPSLARHARPAKAARLRPAQLTELRMNEPVSRFHSAHARR